MKLSLFVLGLLVVSAFATIVPRNIHFKIDHVYKYEYSGHVLTGLPGSGSSLYSGHQLNSTVSLSVVKSLRPVDNGRTVIKMQLDNIVLGHLLEEVTEVEKAIFNQEKVKDEVVSTLSLPVQFTLEEGTNSFEWVEVQKDDLPWSVNIKKSIIDLIQVNVVGKNAVRGANDIDQADLLYGHKLNMGIISFGVHESTIQGECETNYQVIRDADPEKLRDTLPGAEKFYFTVIKTRNFDNCVSRPSLDAHNWDRKGCVEYCKRFAASTHIRMNGLNKHLPIPDETETSCACDPKEATPVDQFSTIRYNISQDTDEPFISAAVGKGKIVVDNHGTKFVVYSQHSILFLSEEINRNVPLIPVESAIRVNDLAFTLFPYKGMESKAYQTHVVPIYNLLVPRNAENLHGPTVDLLGQVAKVVMEGGSSEAQNKAAWHMVQIVQNLAHLPAEDIKRIYDDEARVEDKERFTNSEHSVARQLLLDALAHVGTKATAEWLKMVLAEKELTAYEVRQFVETLPRNTYAPSKTLITLMKQQIKEAIKENDYEKLSAFAVSYGKLISRACRFELNTESNEVELSESSRYVSIDKKFSRKVRSESPIDWPETEEQCTPQDAQQYVDDLFNSFQRVADLKGKIILAQALAHSGQYQALKHLTPYIIGQVSHDECVGYVNKSSESDCTFLRSSIIYSLHHMVPVSPKLLRSIVLPIFSNKVESYELRLAAFTVFMAAGPKRHELEQAVHTSLKGETNRQVIYMVRSILEETANLTQACHLPLATAAREILTSLPVIYNFDGVYSQASYNEWYSEDKSTGFFLNGQFVANNMSYIPRHGYLSIGSHWKSLSNSWFTIAFQQKGLESLVASKIEKIFSPEWFMATLSKSEKIQGEKPIDELFQSLGIENRTEEEAKIKLFVKLYEQTSLFTLDKWTIEAAYKQFSEIITNYASNLNTEYNWVRFYMPSSYAHIIPSDLGLPVVVLKQRPHIVGLRAEGVSIKTELPSLKSFGIEATLVPQMFYTSSMSVSVFQHGLKKNYGVYSLKKTNVYAPVKVSFSFDIASRVLSYSVEPVFETKVLHFSNTNRAFFAGNYIGLPANESPIYKKLLIETLAKSYETKPRYQSQELGMDLEVHLRTERPWFFDVSGIARNGFPAWIIEKYFEVNEFNCQLTLTLRANKKNPSAGVVGSFDYNFALAGDYKEVKHIGNALVHERSMLKKFTRFETESTRITKDEIRQVAEALVQNYPGTINNKKAPTLTRALNWSFRTLSQEDATAYNATLYFVQALDYQTYWVKYVSTLEKPETTHYTLPRVFQVEASLARPALPTELKWETPQLNRFIGKYIANLTWGESFETLAQPGQIILVKGELQRTPEDRVVGEQMVVREWFHDQCEKDIRSKKFMSYACQLLAHEKSYFNKITGTVSFDRDMPKQLVNSTTLAYQVTKLYLNSFWRPWSTIASYAEKNIDGRITFEAKHSNAIEGKPVINFEVRTPHETSLWFKLFFPIERFTGFHPSMYQKASVLPKDQICALMVNHIRTYDNVTFEKPSTKCEYLLTADCSPARRFAVTVQEVAQNKRLVKVIVGKQVILVKSVEKYQSTIEINGEERFVKPGQSHVLNRALEILAVRIFTQNAYLVIELPQEHVRIVTDGQLVKVVTSPIYMGKACGICGNQDQEAHMEFQGPENCIYSVVKDFQNAYSLGECKNEVPVVPPTCGLIRNFEHAPLKTRGGYRASNLRTLYDTEDLFEHIEDYQRNSVLRENLKSRVAHLDERELKTGKYVRPIRRNFVYKNEKGETCFSKYMVPSCEEGQQELVKETMRIPVVCLDTRSHPLFGKYVDEASERIIEEVALYKETDFLTYEAPVICYNRGFGRFAQ